ncbi:PREDICTED: uncharacterized protein LOC109220534 [Nicotiana attenuata]|uniref:uncharacterized protein LOC109220534 n=1 Tax=Nicotiana attenuata TaxID=49451 RepID=UPI000904F396|nr:PREDICTED: uncharacterized protein LOC109220534 [Nicotiana attenuata]
MGGAAGVFHNASGAWVYGFTKPLSHKDVLHAELLALYHGLQLAHHHNLRSLQVKTDSQDLQVIQLQHTFREGNTVVDVLAKHGKTTKYFQSTDVILFDAPPSCALPLLANDVIGTVTLRSAPNLVLH